MSTDSNSHAVPDIDGDILRIDVGPDILGGHKGAIAELHVVGPWCPNAVQLRALRDRCDAILAASVARKIDPGPYHKASIMGLDGELLEVESGRDIPGAEEGVVIRIDILGNEEGPSWIGGVDELAMLGSELDSIWQRYEPPTDFGVRQAVHQAAISETQSDKGEELREAIQSLDMGLVADAAGNLCLRSGEVLATSARDVVWLKRIAAIVNAVVDGDVP